MAKNGQVSANNVHRRIWEAIKRGEAVKVRAAEKRRAARAAEARENRLRKEAENKGT